MPKGKTLATDDGMIVRLVLAHIFQDDGYQMGLVAHGGAIWCGRPAPILT